MPIRDWRYSCVVSDFILEHLDLVGRWSPWLLLATIVALVFVVLALVRRSRGLRSTPIGERLLLAGTILGLVGCGIALVLRLGPLAPLANTAERFAQWKGGSVPGLALTRVRDGSHLSLATLRGRVVVLNFWATWCPPCRAEMPDLVRLANAHPDGDVAVVTVSDEPAERQLKFAVEHALPRDAVIGALGWDMGTFRPFTLILDRDGKVREFYFGAHDYAFFENRVRRLLRGAGA